MSLPQDIQTADARAKDAWAVYQGYHAQFLAAPDASSAQKLFFMLNLSLMTYQHNANSLKQTLNLYPTDHAELRPVMQGIEQRDVSEAILGPVIN